MRTSEDWLQEVRERITESHEKRRLDRQLARHILLGERLVRFPKHSGAVRGGVVKPSETYSQRLLEFQEATPVDYGLDLDISGARAIH